MESWVRYKGALLMSSTGFSYLVKNRLGIFYLQLRIPKHIRDNDPELKPLVRKSLRTRNRREALRLARKLVVWMEDNDFQKNIASWEDEARSGDELFHIGQPLFEELETLWNTGDQVSIDNFTSNLSIKEQSALNYMMELNNSYVEQFKRLLAEGDKEDKVKFIQQLPRIFKKNINDTLNLHFATKKQKSNPPPTPAPIPIKTIHSDEKDPYLDAAYKRWVEEDADQAMKKSSFGEYSRMVELFLRILKEINNNVMPRVSEVNTEMIRYYKEIFSEIPKGVKVANKSLFELVIMDGNKKSPTTIKGTYHNIGTFIKWVKVGYPLQPDIHETLTQFRKIRNSEKKRRVPLDCQDLKALFESDRYRLGHWKRGSEFFVPLIALFTGMTRNEIVQLEVNDIYEKDGYNVIDINERGDKQLKISSNFDDEDEGSTGRPRIIPVHDELNKLGLLDYVAHQKANDETRLFPCEPRNPRGQFGAYGNRYLAYRKKVGAMPRNDKEYRDFHSFRHLMKTKLSDVEKNDGLLDDILGHSSSLRSDTGRGYDHAERIKLKYDAIRKVQYDCIDFSKIRLWKHHKFAKK